MDHTIEQICQPLYDHIEIPADGIAHHSYHFFQRAVGLDKKTFEDTNMFLCGQMPQGNKFLLTSIGVYYAPRHDNEREGIRDTRRILSRGYLELRLVSQTFLRLGPLAHFKPNFPMYWALDDETLDALFKKPTNPDAESIFKGFELVPLLITAYSNFSITITFDDEFEQYGPGRLGVILFGDLYRDQQ
jgi:hypothetical protein